MVLDFFELETATQLEILEIGRKHQIMNVLDTMIHIWQESSLKNLRELESNHKLIPLIKAMIPQLDQAADLVIHPQNRDLALFEILQMAEIPLHPPTLRSLSPTTETKIPTAEERSWKLTPEQAAISKAMGDAAERAILRGLARDNLEVFGTPIPDELKD